MAGVGRPRRPPGPGPETAKRELFLRLIGQGLNNSAACRQAGVHWRTGTRWRYGRRAVDVAGRSYEYPSIMRPAPTLSDRFLSPEERLVIADQLRTGMTLRAIARGLGRSPSTVSREVRRNRDPVSREYRSFTADLLAKLRRRREREGKLAGCPLLHRLVQDGLARRWSPEQISRTLRRDHPADPELQVAPETIYQALYVQGRGQLRREVAAALRTGRTRRKPHRTTTARNARFDSMVNISERPAEAEDRAVPGHWEGDLIIGAGNGSAIGTLVERTTRFVVLLHLPQGRTAEAVRDGIVAGVSTLPQLLRRSLTWDQGSEMARHTEITLAADMPVFFCNPASPWQRGSNENANGLLRQYFPKGTDLAVHSAEHLASVAAELNQRPRKTLGWDTPAQRLSKLLKTAA